MTVLVYFTGSNVMTERVTTLNLQPWQFVAAVDVTVYGYLVRVGSPWTGLPTTLVTVHLTPSVVVMPRSRSSTSTKLGDGAIVCRGTSSATVVVKVGSWVLSGFAMAVMAYARTMNPFLSIFWKKLANMAKVKDM